MNPVTLDAIRLFIDLQSINKDNSEYCKKIQKMIDDLLFIVEKDIAQAHQKYASVKLV